MSWWFIISMVMFFPGCLKLFAAWRLFPFRSEPAGLITFVVCLIQGLLWAMLGLIVFFGSIFGQLALDLPLPVAIIVCVVFLADRLTAALESLWMAGVLRADWFRKAEHVKKK